MERVVIFSLCLCVCGAAILSGIVNNQFSLTDSSASPRAWNTVLKKEQLNFGNKRHINVSGRKKNRLQRMHLRRAPRAATAYRERLWDYAVIPYEIADNFQGRLDVVKQAMRHWENFTCIKFVERNKSEHQNYVSITETPCGCCSFFVGKKGNGAQEISIAPRCKFGNILHELGHAIGFWHEHSRPDRDQHVNIIKDNIISGWENNFNKLPENEIDTLGSSYDYNSIMHYAKTGFAKSKYLDTIRPIGVADETQFELGQRHSLSEGDIAQTNMLYNCPKCGGTLQGNSGFLKSPSGDHCEWRITGTQGERIVLNVTSININCKTDYIELRDGYWYKSPLLAKLCGVHKNEIVTSTGSRMLVTYVTKSKKEYQEFEAEYHAVCGGDFHIDAEIIVESPGYPEDYQPNKECVWNITVPSNYKIALKFLFFELEHHELCLYDYVQVKDKSSILGTFCGDQLPDDLMSTSNHLQLKFVSDGSVQTEGFSVSILKEFDECSMPDHGCSQECVNTLGSYHCRCKIGYELQPDGKTCIRGCGGVLTTATGTISTPSFPELYPSKKTCIWEIVAAPQDRVVLNFTHFDIEGNGGENFYRQVCDYDKLELYDVDGDIIEKSGVFCGTSNPGVLLSHRNTLRVVFTSDDDTVKTGFSADFYTDKDECSLNNGGCQHKCVKTINSYKCTCPDGFLLHENGHNCTKGDCVFEISSPFGSFGTPNYPEAYPNVADCVWIFTTTPGHRIRVSFLIFEIEHHVECFFDQVEFFDGSSADDRSLGRFCGSDLPQTVTSSGNNLYVTFKSDESNRKKGFWATYSSICGGIEEADLKQQRIYSHARFGLVNYDDNTDCEWTVISRPGYQTKLSFEAFDLELERDCSYDYVEILSDADVSVPTDDRRFCGSIVPPDVVTEEESVVVRFKSDGSFSNKGFILVYESVSEKYTKND